MGENNDINAKNSKKKLGVGDLSKNQGNKTPALGGIALKKCILL